MSQNRILLLFIFFGIGALCVPNDITYAISETYTFGELVSTDSTILWNNDNWSTQLHPMVRSFTIKEGGDAYGITETGVSFVQYNVENSLGARIQRFEMGDHYHYIINGEVVYTLADFSIQLSHVYKQTYDPVT